MVFFWACEVSETKATAVEVPAGFVLNVCNATTGSFPCDSVVSLGVETQQMDQTPWKGVVAHLGKPAGAWQVKLDLVFSQKVKFYLAKGVGKVHVSGYFQPGPPADMFEDDIPVIIGEPEAAPTDAKKSKKRARGDGKAAVSWDQTPSSDSETEEPAPKHDKPVKTVPAATKKQEKKQDKQPQQEKKPQVAVAPAANGASPVQPGGGKKKRHKKHKKAADTSSQ